MNAWLRSLAILAALAGLTLLCISCSEETGPEPGLNSAWRAATSLMDHIAIDSGAVVSFVGPVPPGTGLHYWGFENPGLCFTVPESLRGWIYLFFVNDQPDRPYPHPVRFAWFNLSDQAFDTLRANEPPWLDIEPPDTSEFELIDDFRYHRVLFYYGRGGGAGFPQGYLP